MNIYLLYWQGKCIFTAVYCRSNFFGFGVVRRQCPFPSSTTVRTRKVPIVLNKPINEIITVVWPIIAFSLQPLIMLSRFGSSKLLNLLFSRVCFKKNFQGETWWNRISGRHHVAWGGGDPGMWYLILKVKTKRCTKHIFVIEASKMCALVLNTE